MTEINNQLIEFEHVYSGTLTADSISKVQGHRVFKGDGNFAGLLDKEHNTVWSVITESLVIIK